MSSPTSIHAGVVVVALAIALAGCGNKKGELAAQVNRQSPADSVAKALVGVLNISGDVNRAVVSSCGGRTGFSGDGIYGCNGSCVGSEYRLECSGKELKTFSCGSAEFKMEQAKLIGHADHSHLQWNGNTPSGTSKLSVSFHGKIQGPEANGEAGEKIQGTLDCAFPATLTFQKDREIPSFAIDCSQYHCALEGTPIECSELQARMTVDICDKY